MRLTGAQKRIVAEIRKLRRRRKALNISAVRQHSPRLLLSAYQVVPFWGWKQALEAAGIDYSSIEVELPEYVTCRICGKECKSLVKHLYGRHDMSPQRYLAGYPGAELLSPAHAARRQHPSKSGMPHWEPNWTPEYVLDRAHEMHVQGLSLNPTDVYRHDRPCYALATRYFGNWDMVLRAIGVDPRSVRKRREKRRWTKQSVKQELARCSVQGRPVNWQAMQAYDSGLANMAVKMFGSYDNALRACGLDPKKVRKAPVRPNRYKTKDDVISAILRRKLKSQAIYQHGVTHGSDPDNALYGKAVRFFGGWGAAIEAAGLDYNKVRHIPPPHTPEHTIDAIQRRCREGLPMTAKSLRHGPHKDKALYYHAYKNFGGWAKAVCAAGSGKDFPSGRTTTSC